MKMHNKRMRNLDCGLLNDEEAPSSVVDVQRARFSCLALRSRSATQSALRTPHSAFRIPRSSRRGILLLVVLSMLTLFLLIGTAFIVSANHYRQINKIQAQITEASNSSIDQDHLLNEVINQVVRDTNNQNSTLRFHSLLRDMYGNDGLLAEIGNVEWAKVNIGDTADTTNVTGGQILQFQLTTGTNIASIANTISDQFGISFRADGLSQIDNAYNGLVLTFLSGPARGQSVRVVGYFPPVIDSATGDINIQPVFRVISPRKADGSTLVFADFSVMDGSRIAINGRPFNGTGVGYDPNAPAGTSRLTAFENFFGISSSHALVPNQAYHALTLTTENLDETQLDQLLFDNPVDNYLTQAQQQNLSSQLNSTGITDPVDRKRAILQTMGIIGAPGLGGSDESYDVADFQNMLLAVLQANPSETPVGINDLGNVPIPSLHRPALFNYWWNNGAITNGTDFEPNALRKIMLRPSWMDHPNFTGSNPEFANRLSAYQSDMTLQNDLLNTMIYGPWDVDNDNDGVRDSIWVDFGAPVMENADGRLVKPLAAIMVLDMDGRLNLNAHGSEDIANATSVNFDMLDGELAGGQDTDNLPHGTGFGPAEISLDPLMAGGDATERWDWYKRVFRGAAARERFDATDARLENTGPAPVGDAGRRFLQRRAGKLGSNEGTNAVPGMARFDIEAQLKMQGVPRWRDGTVEDPNNAVQSVLAGYVSPPDFRGRYALGLNALGQPVYESLFDAPSAENIMNVNTPYELDLSLGALRGEENSSDDTPFSVAELERVLRAYDADAGMLPARIWDFAGEFKDNPTDTTPNLTRLNLWRTATTTDSYDLPVPSVVVPSWMVETGPDTTTPGDEYATVMNKPAVGATYADLLEYRIRVGLGILNPNVLDPSHASFDATQLDNVQREMRKLMPADLANGLRLDINRPVGNGRDDNGNGVVDEPGEWNDTDGNGTYDGELEAPFWASSDDPNRQLDAFTGRDGNQYGLFRDAIDRDGDGDVENWERGDADNSGAVDTFDELVFVHNLRRQMLARDLFVMAMTLVDPYTLTTPEGKAKTRQLAQWAINTVDFRDPDNIMTAFEYDENPFDGWQVDGNVANTDGYDGASGTPDDDNTTQREIVWGAERPELLMTETLAWHDRRTEDHVDEDISATKDTAASVEDSMNPDQDFDQRVAPRGAGFIELYNPWPANPAVNADTHVMDDIDGDGVLEDLGVDLAARDQLLGSSPVWRVAVYRNARTVVGAGGVVSPPRSLSVGQAATLDPDAPDANERPNIIDRCIYFCGFDPETPPADFDGEAITPRAMGWDNDGVAFFEGDATQGMLSMRASMPADQQAGPVVRPGAYMVVGSGEERSGVYESPIGDLTKDANPTNSATMQPWRMVMDPNSVLNPIEFVVDPLSDPASSIAYNAPNDPNDNTRAICDIAIMNKSGDSKPGIGALPSTPGTPDGEVRRFTFSEPVTTATSKEYPPLLAGGIPLDVPFDNNRDDDLNGDFMKLGFSPGFRWVYLQRLANPLLPWNPEKLMPNGLTPNPHHDPNLSINPYCTIDHSPVNLTVFNGRSDQKFRVRAAGTGELGDEVINGAIFKNNDAFQGFASVERGQRNDPNEASKDPNGSGAARGADQSAMENLWNPENPGYTRQPKTDAATGGARHRFSRAPTSTIGFLNSAYSQESGLPPDETLLPDEPFPWLAWNNRPFASSAELLQIPNVRSSQLMRAFSMQTPGGTTTENYDGATNSQTVNLETDGLYRHQQNFFRTDDGGGTNGIAGLYRLLDYLHVPSPFVGTEMWLNPARFGDDTIPAIANTVDPRYGMQPPFNRVAEYRDPGRVNLNTVVNKEVYFGLMHGDTSPSATGSIHPGATWNSLVDSRRIYPGTTGAILQLDPDTPTFFGNPLRNADAVDLVPTDSLLLDANGNPREGVQATMLREGAVANTPLFAADTMTNEYNNSDRNPYFRYQPMTRLSSMTTTRSNVYAVWVTVGFFEVTEAPAELAFATANGLTAGSAASLALYDRVYPEGYQLGQEAGSDTGDIRRVREFAIIDRTVPVAFEPGQNHNIDKAVRLRRRIE